MPTIGSAYRLGGLARLRLAGVLGLVGLLALAVDNSPAGAGSPTTWPDLSQPQAGGEPHSKDVALVVAIEHYAELPAIPRALDNAGDWHAYLTRTLQIPVENVRLLRDKDGTVEKIRKGAQELAARAKPGGTMWFLFIGHGAPSVDGKDGLLIGYDAQQDLDSVAARSLTRRQLLSLLATGGQSHTIALLDACFSGKSTSGQPLIKGLQPFLVLREAAERRPERKLTLLSAARADQFAGPLPGAGRPAFSYLALGGLRGWADENHDGRVSAAELRSYIEKALLALLRDRTQSPELSSGDGQQILGIGSEAGPELGRMQGAAPPPEAAVLRTLPSTENSDPASPASARYDTVAVAAFQTQGLPTEQAFLGKSFADALLTRLAQAHALRVVEREFLDQLLAELKLQQSGVVDAKSAVRVGQLLGARYFIFGNLTLLADDLVVRTRIVHVERGEVIDATEAIGTTRGMLSLQAQVAGQTLSALSLGAALNTPGQSSSEEFTLTAYRDLDRLREQVRGLPPLGLDPARNRQEALYAQGLSLCDRLLASYPRLGEAHYLRGLLLLQREDFAGAAQAVALAQRLGWSDVSGHLLRGNILFAADDRAGALKVYDEVTRSFPGDARAYYAKGRILLLQGQSQPALLALIRALLRTPSIADVESTLQTLLRDGSTSLADLATSAPREFAIATTLRALFRGETEGVEAVAAQVIQQNPNLYLGYLVRGKNASRRGAPEAGVPLLTRALALQPESAGVHRALGEALLRLGQCGLGQQHLLMYLRIAPVIRDQTTIETQIANCSSR